MTQPTTAEQQEFASRLALMMNEAGKLRLYRTMHKIHDAVRAVGWEIAASAPDKRTAEQIAFEVSRGR